MSVEIVAVDLWNRMGSNHDRTEAALAAVLSLCNCSVGQEDMEAVQRHDEAAIALLDVNEDASLKVHVLRLSLDALFRIGAV